MYLVSIINVLCYLQVTVPPVQPIPQPVRLTLQLVPRTHQPVPPTPLPVLHTHPRVPSIPQPVPSTHQPVLSTHPLVPSIPPPAPNTPPPVQVCLNPLSAVLQHGAACIMHL